MKKVAVLIATIACICASCSQGNEGYNRGIGIYPGNPDEDFSPVLSTDKQYRNIALNRAVYSSSSYDYCLTGQLTTDGIVENTLPKYMAVESSAKASPKREREWLTDQFPNLPYKRMV